MAAHATPPAPRAASHTSPTTADMLSPRAAVAAQPGREYAVRAVTVLVGTVVGLSFLFGFGNVLALGIRLGVPAYVAPLVAPAVDLSIVALLLGTRHLALHGAGAAQIRPARRLLVFCSVVSLALNVAEPLIAEQYGRAAYDAVGPALLIIWADVGPGLLQAMNEVGGTPPPPAGRLPAACGAARAAAIAGAAGSAAPVPEQRRGRRPSACGEDLLERARAEDARHWVQRRRPISAETLRKRLHIGAAASRALVPQVRADTTAAGHPAQGVGSAEAAGAS